MKFTDKEITSSYQQSKPKIISFFDLIKTEYKLSEEQKDELIYSVRNLIYFLKLNSSNRLEIEKDFYNNIKKGNSDKYKRLTKFSSENDDLVDYIAPIREKSRFHELFQYKIQILKNSVNHDKKLRAGLNNLLLLQLRDLIVCMEKIGFRRTDQINVVYKLFVEFKFDDFGSRYSKNFSEDDYKVRIRRHFISPIINGIEKEMIFDKEFPTFAKELKKTPDGNKILDFVFGRDKTF